MSLLKVTKTNKYKTISFLGMKVDLLRTRYRDWLKTHQNISFVSDLRSDGFSLMGYWDETNGESQVGKDFTKALTKAGITFDQVEVRGAEFCIDEEKSQFYPRFKNKIVFTTDNYSKFPRYNNIPVLFWEFESGCLEVRPYLFNGIQKAIVFSDFDLNYFKSIAPKGVDIIKLSYPFDFDAKPTENQKQTRTKYGIKDDDFVCFYNFSYCSSYERKNAEGVLDAFATVFKGKNDAKLIIKTQGAEIFHEESFAKCKKLFLAEQNKKILNCPERLHKKIKSLDVEHQVLVIDEVVSRNEMLNLVNCCDVYVSLHRGEGLGLGMLEAMGMGKPVVATNYGGNTDFVHDDVAFPIDYTLVAPKQVDLSAYQFVEKWAEPNVDQAVGKLSNLYEDRSLRIEIGEKAKSFVAEKYSIENFVQSLEAIK